MTLSSDLHALADRLARLAPSHRDPFRFHEEKSELVHELHVLASSVRITDKSPANDNAKGFLSAVRAARRREASAATTSKMEVVKKSLTTAAAVEN